MSFANSLPAAVLADGGLVFNDDDGIAKALDHGLLYLAEPCDLDFEPAIRFAQSFYLPDLGERLHSYTGYKERELPASKLGFSIPSSDQVELFQLELPLWNEVLPNTVAHILHAMNDMAKSLLFAVAREIGVSTDDLNEVANGMLKDQALQYCIFNHYRRSLEASAAFTAHQDSGLITLLYTTEAGLETFEDGVWHDVPPRPGYFTVVLGHSLEVLLARSSRNVRASYHRVRADESTEAIPDRFSFGVYIGPRFDQSLLQYSRDGILEEIMPFIEFQKQKALEMGFVFHEKVNG